MQRGNMAHIIKKMLDDLYNEGTDPEEIKSLIVGVLVKYFQHPEALQRAVTNSEILSAFEFEVRYHYEPDFTLGIMEVLECYRNALRTDAFHTLGIFIASLTEASEKENQMWTVRNNSPSEDVDDVYDYVASHMRHIGDTLETGTKYIIYELYALIRLAKNKSIDYEAIKRSDFGVILNNILDYGNFVSILKTTPNNVKLSDWRNIAYHHSYHINNNLVICTYGKSRKQFELTINEFGSYCHKIARASNILNIARCFFAFDNLDDLISLKPTNSSQITFRKPLLIEHLRISAMSQGFKIVNLEETDDVIAVSLLDLKNDDLLDEKEIQKRKIHSSQFLYNIWCVFNKKRIVVIYCNKKGTPITEFGVEEKICREIHEGKPLSYMVTNMTIKTISI
jgi:hypothetical protein